MRKTLVLLSALAFGSDAMAISVNLGPATGYNIFVKEDFNQPGADSQGKVAVGRDANIGIFDVAVNYENTNSDVLVVGRDLTTTGWGNIKGNAIVGGTVSDATGHSAQGTVTQGTPIDFTAAFDYFTTLSSTLKELPSVGVEFKYGNWIILDAPLDDADDALVVANITGSMLKDATELTGTGIGPNNTLVINVSGVNIDFDSLNYGPREGLSLGLEPQHILFNFYEAETITFQGGFYANILAPHADFTFTQGDLSGQVIAKSWTGGWGAQPNLWDGYFVPYEGPDSDPLPPNNAVPAPAPLYLVATGLLAMAGFRRRAKQS